MNDPFYYSIIIIMQISSQSSYRFAQKSFELKVEN